MNRPVRLAVIMTHPVQYCSPWFRHIAVNHREIDLRVIYAVRPDPTQQGIGFGQSFCWDRSVTEGYSHTLVRPSRPNESVHSDDFWGLNVPEIGDAIRESRPDVALIMGWYSVTLVRALLVCKKLRIPVIYRGDTHLGSAPTGWKRPLWRAKTRFLLKLFNCYLSVGMRSREFLRSFGTPPSRVYHAPHCVDNKFFAEAAAPYQNRDAQAAVRRKFGLEPDEFVVLFVGKLEPKKRPLDIIRALSRMYSSASLLIVGAGPLEAACRAEAEKLNVRVAWAGFLNQTELGSAYAAADCLVLPSDWGETWGLVVNEAMSTGLPCIVSDRVGCAPDLITPGVTGETFAMGNIQAFAASLERIRELRNSGRDFKKACCEKVAAYSYEAASIGLAAACQSMLQLCRTDTLRQNASQSRVIACCGAMFFISGVERMTFEVLRILRASGAAVHCIVNTSANWDRPQEKHLISAMAEQIGATWSTGYYWYRLTRQARNPIKLLQISWDIAMTSFGLLRDAKQFHPTHVLIPDFLTVLRNWPALAILRLLGIRIIIHVHNPPPAERFYAQIWRLGVHPVVDKFVCCSQHVQQQLWKLGLPKNKTSVVYNTAPSRLRLESNNAVRNLNKLIFVGQLIPEKGLDLLFDAMAMLVRRGYDVSLDVVGDVEGWAPEDIRFYREGLKARAAVADLTGRIQFLGWREDVPTLLAHSGIHCVPSRPTMFEGLPLVNLEAKLAGIPSVAFNIGPFPELIIDGQDGFLCREVGATALAEGIEYFLADPGRLKTACAAAHSSAERFSRAQFTIAWREIFTETCTRWEGRLQAHRYDTQ